MKIKLTTPGYVAFTGWIGDVQFDNGASVSAATAAQVAFVSAMHTIEEVEGETAEQEVTPTGQEGGETTTQEQEVTSEEQKEAEEGAEQAEKAEQAAEGDEAKE